MSTSVRFEPPRHGAVYVNPDRVAYVRKFQEASVTVKFSGLDGDSVVVMGDLDQIAKALDESRG